MKSVPSSVAKGARRFARSRRLPLRWRPCQPIGVDMRLIIEARLEGAPTSASATEPTIVAVVERQDRSVADLGLTLTEGRCQR